jgi:hypothetical protein
MGREERRQAVLPVPARNALRCLFASAGTYFREYHRTYTQDDAAAVAPWDETRCRVVTFKKKLDVPAVVLKLLGTLHTWCELQPVWAPPGQGGWRRPPLCASLLQGNVSC